MPFTQRISGLEVFFLFSFFFVLFSCRKADTGTSNILLLNKIAIRIDTAVGTVDSFRVQSTIQWTASISPDNDWLRIDRSSGGQGNAQVKLTVVSNNNTVLTQVATITITAVNAGDISPVTLTVTKRPLSFSLDYHKEFGGTKEEAALRSTAKTSDGGIIITGAASSNDGDVHGNHGDADFWIVKLNAAGDTAWTKTYGGTGEDRPSSIVTVSNEGYVVCGSTSSIDGDIHRNRGGSDVWVLKLDLDGNLLWTKTYGGTGNERANSIITTPDGGYAVAGYTDSNNDDIHNNHGSGDMWILKLNGIGDTLWTKTYGGSQWDEAGSIVATADGGYALAGLTNSNDQDVSGFHVSSFFSFDMWIVRVDAMGNKLWAKAVGGSANDVALSMITTTGGFVITGYTNSNDGDVTGYHDGQGTDDMWVVKLSADGIRQWAKTIGGTDDDVSGSIIPVSDGYIVSGFTKSNDGDFSGSGYHGNYDIGVVKLFVH